MVAAGADFDGRLDDGDDALLTEQDQHEGDQVVEGRDELAVDLDCGQRTTTIGRRVRSVGRLDFFLQYL